MNRLYRKLLIWLVGKEINKDDIRYDYGIFHQLIEKTCDVEMNNFHEDNAYGLVYLLIHSILKSIKFKHPKSEDITLLDLDSNIILSGINTEIVAYYMYNGDVDFANDMCYTAAKAKLNLINNQGD